MLEPKNSCEQGTQTHTHTQTQTPTYTYTSHDRFMFDPQRAKYDAVS
jgi:hypothetical protein